MTSSVNVNTLTKSIIKPSLVSDRGMLTGNQSDHTHQLLKLLTKVSFMSIRAKLAMYTYTILGVVKSL